MSHGSQGFRVWKWKTIDFFLRSTYISTRRRMKVKTMESLEFYWKTKCFGEAWFFCLFVQCSVVLMVVKLSNLDPRSTHPPSPLGTCRHLSTALVRPCSVRMRMNSSGMQPIWKSPRGWLFLPFFSTRWIVFFLEFWYLENKASQSTNHGSNWPPKNH